MLPEIMEGQGVSRAEPTQASGGPKDLGSK